MIVQGGRHVEDGLSMPKRPTICPASSAAAPNKRRMPTAVISTPATKRAKLPDQPSNRLPSLTDAS